jgi:hypothetical protein
MRKTIGIALLIIASVALAAGAHAADQSQRRAKEIASNIGSIKIHATGQLNTVISVYDSNDIANADYDYGLIENHRDALLKLGFKAVHVRTAKGETLDRPL